MNRRGMSLLETIIAISITTVIAVAIASMMAASATGLTSKDDGRKSAIRLAATKVRLSAYIAPARCILENKSSKITLWLNDNRESNTVHASEVRWIQFNNNKKNMTVQFISFPKSWSEEMIEAADTECTLQTNYRKLLKTFNKLDLVETIPLIDAVASCTFWVNNNEPSAATMVSTRYSLISDFGVTTDAFIDETLRIHKLPLE